MIQAYNTAMYSMARLNRNAARLMHKYGQALLFLFLINPPHQLVGSHGATDVTGFGILGHLRNLAGNQKQDVSFCLHSLPGVWSWLLYHY